MFIKYIKEPAITVLAITAFAYTVNLLYEFSKLNSLGVSAELVEVKTQNFLITGVLLLAVAGGVRQIHLSTFEFIDKRFYKKSVDTYLKEMASVMIASIFLTIILSLIPIIKAYQDTYENGQEFLNWSWMIGVLAMVLIFFSPIYHVILAKVHRHNIVKYLDKKVIRPRKKRVGDSKNDAAVVIYLAGALLGVILLSAVSSANAKSTENVYAIPSDNMNIKQVIVSTYHDLYIIKEFNSTTRKYNKGYSLLDMKNRKVDFYKNL